VIHANFIFLQSNSRLPRRTGQHNNPSCRPQKQQTSPLHCRTVWYLEHIPLGSIYRCLKFTAANLHFNLVGFVMAVQFEQMSVKTSRKLLKRTKKNLSNLI
jgi:hypothetical protein